MNELSERDIGRTVWLLVGVLIVVLITGSLYTQIGTLLFALFLYYATRPLYRRLDEYLTRSNLAVTLTVLAIVVPMLVIVSYALIQALNELDQFLALHSLTGYRTYLRPYLGLVYEGRLQRLAELLVQNPSQSLPAGVRGVTQHLVGGVSTVFGFVVTVLGHLFLLLIFLFYLLRDDQQLAAWFYDHFDDRRVVEFTTAVDADLQTVFFSNLAIVAVSGGIAILTFFLLNLIAPGGAVVTVPILLGLLIGIATLIPVFGMKLVYVPYIVYLAGLALFSSTPLWHPVVFAIVTATIVDLIPDFFVRSYLSARSGVHMGLILLGYIVGSLAFGWYGLFFGPLVVVIAVHYADQIVPDLANRVDFG